MGYKYNLFRESNYMKPLHNQGQTICKYKPLESCVCRRERFVGEKIALFSETVKLCLDLNVRMIIDVKDESAKVSWIT